MGFWKKACAPLLLVGLASPALVNCDALGGIVPGADCPALKDGNFANLKLEGSAEVQGKLKGFLESVYALHTLSVDMEKGLIESCGELGKAVGMAEADVTAEPAEGEGAKKVCTAVAEKVKAMINAAGGATLKIEVGEPRCEVDIDAMTACLGECGSPIDPGKLEASCEGGEISGTCEGECKGTCTLEAGAQCSGSCAGNCEGKCDGKDSKGKCAGKCEGKCDAGCKVEGAANCSGSCSGGCSVDVKAPKCSGEFKPPSVDPSCQMNCTAKTAGSAKCHPPTLNVSLEGEGSTDLNELIAGLQVALPKIINIQLGMGKRLVITGKALVEQGQELPQIATQAGLQGVGCIAMAGKMAVSASASISLNVEASASVSASAGGG